MACAARADAGAADTGASSPRVEVRFVRIDGTTGGGEWVGCGDGKSLELDTSSGNQRVRLDGLERIEFDVAATAPEGDELFHLADGGLLWGRLLGPSPDGVVGRTLRGDAVNFPFDRLAGEQLVRAERDPQAHQRFLRSLAKRLPGQDVLVTRGPDDARVLRGRLEAIDRERGLFEFGGRTRTIRFEKVFGVVFAAGGSPEPNHAVTVSLADGSRLSGRVVSADRTSLLLATSLGFEASLPLRLVASIEVHSTRVIYLSDLVPMAERVEGRLHRPWPIQRDRSVSGGPLSIGGTVFPKGLGVHSRTELVYDIGGRVEQFAATIGVDDAVRPGGSVVFRALDEGRLLFDSGKVTGTDPPRDVLVDVTGVKLLTLAVEFSDALDLSDHADWGNARLLKPPPDGESRGVAP